MNELETLTLISQKLDVIIGFLIVVVAYGLFKAVTRCLSMMFGSTN